MSLNDVLSLNGIAFLQSAFQLILHRDLDIIGQKHYSARMRAGVRKYDVISDLVKSPEGRKRGVVVPGLKKYLRRQRWADIPVIGRIARQFYTVESNDPVSRQIRALQMQLATDGIGGSFAGSVVSTGLFAQREPERGETTHDSTTYLALDLARQDDLSTDTIAIYALLKSPA